MSLEDKAGHSGWSGLLAFFEVWRMKVSIACSGVYGIIGGRRTLANKYSSSCNGGSYSATTLDNALARLDRLRKMRLIP